MEFDEYDYLEKTIENPELPKVKETTNDEGDIVKSKEKDRPWSSKTSMQSIEEESEERLK
ncbi:hypothetical protein SADUNF_Sadunf12G0048900 [Salix dunnii]|uniref:Uncharacterized protein n=1 Tax=Salix dunnii TaxID=1413687 RepID=A0A835MPB5_9ROSI|nr:hypothetical protein SADUNF_Sadunf12G0048900 [Salix dunnii]